MGYINLRQWQKSTRPHTPIAGYFWQESSQTVVRSIVKTKKVTFGLPAGRLSIRWILRRKTRYQWCVCRSKKNDDDFRCARPVVGLDALMQNCGFCGMSRWMGSPSTPHTRTQEVLPKIILLLSSVVVMVKIPEFRGACLEENSFVWRESLNVKAAEKCSLRPLFLSTLPF